MRSLKELADHAHSLKIKGYQLSKAEGLTFEEWKSVVDYLIQRKCGLDADSIDDWTYMDDYESEIEAGDCRDSALENAGFFEYDSE